MDFLSRFVEFFGNFGEQMSQYLTQASDVMWWLEQFKQITVTVNNWIIENILVYLKPLLMSIVQGIAIVFDFLMTHVRDILGRL